VGTPDEFNPAYDRKNILFVGVDWERKGGPELVEAFRAVRDRFPDARLTIVGCSPRIDMPGCEVAGKVPLADVHQYFEQASIFCLPTRLEPFGVVFVEALHHKLPIVATNVGAIPDFVIEGESGYLVPPRAVELLAQALVSLIGDPEKCRQFGEKGFNLARERYSWERVGARIRETVNYYL
jgi:glycosyltransferase involved in cell wall biosynthesis